MTPRPSVAPAAVATAELQLPGGHVARLDEVTWDLGDFIVGDPELAEAIGQGKLLTYAFHGPSGLLHLEQRGSAFWSSSPLRVESRDPPRRFPDGRGPRWRKRSCRSWPFVEGAAVPYLAQTQLGLSDVYLFRLATGSVLLHRVDCFEQDVEDHYDRE